MNLGMIILSISMQCPFGYTQIGNPIVAFGDVETAKEVAVDLQVPMISSTVSSGSVTYYTATWCKRNDPR